MSKHIAAIHVLKSKLALTEDDYRALLIALTGVDSCKRMSPLQLAAVRTHLQKLAEKLGVAKPASGVATSIARATPKERKVWAMWNALGRAGKLDNPSPQALQAWVKRQVGVEAVRFCNGGQLDELIESMKMWSKRA